MGVGFIKINHRNVKSFKDIEAHLKYIGFRSREMEPTQERFFTATEDRANWREFYDNIEGHRALQHGHTVKVHKLIFSLRSPDYDAYRLSGRDYRHVVREVLKQYEQRKSFQLNWIASRHDRNSDHPHCHVVIRGVTEKGRDGKCKRVFLTKEDIRDLRRDFNNEISRHRVLERDRDYLRDRSREPVLDRRLGKSTERSVFDLFDQFIKALERQRLQQEYERDRDR